MSERGMRDPLIKHKKRRRRKRRIARFFLFLLSLAAFTMLVAFVFETRELTIRGVQYGSVEEVQQWIEADPLSRNTLFLFGRYNNQHENTPAFVDYTQVSFLSPWNVEIIVREKPMYGYVMFGELFAHFDRDGIVSLLLDTPMDGVPMFQELTFLPTEIRLGQVLPVEDPYIFTQWAQITHLLQVHELIPESVCVPGGWFQLQFGPVEVRVGSRDFEDKIAQLPPILTTLQKDFPGQFGVLHMETWALGDASIRFVPEAIGEQVLTDDNIVVDGTDIDSEPQDIVEGTGG